MTVNTKLKASISLHQRHHEEPKSDPLIPG
jgi:hypothetical protein